MAIKHTATDRNGKVHKRNSDRTYTHAVIVHHAAIPAQGNFGPWEARSTAEWRSRSELAEALASSYRGKGRDVEVILANLEGSEK